jgi:hypothetical protein
MRQSDLILYIVYTILLIVLATVIFAIVLE